MTPLHRLVSNTHWANPRLPDGDFRSVLFGDFRVDADGISTWAAPVEFAVQVMASAFREIRAVTILEIPEQLVDEIGIQVRASPGRTPDSASEAIHRSIECPGGSLLSELVERLSREPSYQWFSTGQVRTLLAERLGVGVTLRQLKPRVVDDLMRSGLVDAGRGAGGTRCLFR